MEPELSREHRDRTQFAFLRVRVLTMYQFWLSTSHGTYKGCMLMVLLECRPLHRKVEPNYWLKNSIIRTLSMKKSFQFKLVISMKSLRSLLVATTQTNLPRALLNGTILLISSTGLCTWTLFIWTVKNWISIPEKLSLILVLHIFSCLLVSYSIFHLKYPFLVDFD